MDYVNRQTSGAANSRRLSLNWSCLATGGVQTWGNTGKWSWGIHVSRRLRRNRNPWQHGQTRKGGWRWRDTKKLKIIYNHYANFLKLRHFAEMDQTHKKIMATICRGFRRRRQRQRRRQVYFKSSTDSGGVRSILLVARTILERQKSDVTACHRSDIKVIKLNGLENTDSQMRIKKKTW